MKRIFSYLFAIITLMGTTGVFTSCQEDAPAINYTINVTVNNDFTEVLNAINNGNLSQSDAIEALTAAINQMSGDQETKYQALLGAINGLATTLEAKLAVIEAAMQAQALALEGKIDLLSAAIAALPDYTEKLDAIEAAIKALPDYSDKLAAIETAIQNIPDYSEKLAAIEEAIKNAPDYSAALEEIKEAIAALPDYSEQLGAIIAAIEALPDYSEQLGAIQAAIEAIPDYTDQLTAIQTALEAIKQQNSENATAIADLQASIDDIAKAVEEGNKSQEDALTEILALIQGVEDEVVFKYATFTLNKAIGEEITITVNFASEVDPMVDTFIGLTDIEIIKEYAEGIEYDIKGKLTSSRVGILKDVRYLVVNDLGITSIDVRNAVNLKILQCTDNQIKSIDVTNNTKLEWLICKNNLIEKMDLSKNTKLEWIKVQQNKLTSLVVGCSIKTIEMELNELNETAMDAFISSMHSYTSSYTAKIYVKHSDASEKNEITDTQIAAIQALNYKVYLHDGTGWKAQ